MMGMAKIFIQESPLNMTYDGTKFPHKISWEKIFTVTFSFLIPSYPVICHCVRIHISTHTGTLRPHTVVPSGS
jgi:hypothetical protein